MPGGPVYRWAQSMGEVVITLPLPPGVRSRALSCTFKRTQLCATLKGAAEPLLNVEVLPTHYLPNSPHPPVSPRPLVSPHSPISPHS